MFGECQALFESTVADGIVDRLVIFEKLDAFVDALWFAGGFVSFGLSELRATSADGKCDSCQGDREY